MAPTQAQQAQIDALTATWEPAIARAFLEAVSRATTSVDIAALIDALERKDIEAAVALLRMDTAQMFPMLEAMRGAYIAAGASIAQAAPAAIAATWAFNGRDPRAERWIAERGADLIQSNEAETRQAVRAAILAGIEEGRAPPAIARDITGRLNRITGRREGGIIGLTSQQTDWVISARAELTRLDKNYFTRKQRDTRFDPMVRKAIESGKPLSQADIDKVTGRYKDRLLKLRGQVIARNEAMTAQAAGREEAYRQMLARPDVEAVTVRWQHNLSKEPREDHLAMNGTVIQLGETFQFPDAAMKHPHDPAGGAKHSISCRCIAVYRIRLRKD